MTARWIVVAIASLALFVNRAYSAEPLCCSCENVGSSVGCPGCLLVATVQNCLGACEVVQTPQTSCNLKVLAAAPCSPPGGSCAPTGCCELGSAARGGLTSGADSATCAETDQTTCAELAGGLFVPGGSCNGGLNGNCASPTPSATPTATPSVTATATITSTATSTSTPTQTATSTLTATATGTPTPQPNGAGCTGSGQCASKNCVDSVCCDTACTDPLMRCNLPGQVGTCASAAAAAPTLTPWGLLVGMILLGVSAAWALRRRAR